MCERCHDPNKTATQIYTIHKGDSKRKLVLCDECAEITRAVHRLTGGKAAEETPVPPEPEEPVEEEAAEEVTPTVAPLGQSRPSRPHRR